jgi:hypothetical protein
MPDSRPAMLWRHCAAFHGRGMTYSNTDGFQTHFSFVLKELENLFLLLYIRLLVISRCVVRIE